MTDAKPASTIMIKTRVVRKKSKTIERIQSEMKRYAVKDGYGFAFPNGTAIYTEQHHGIIAENITKSLRLNINSIDDRYIELMRYFQNLGIVRFGQFMSCFYVSSSVPINNKVETTILDYAAGKKYNLAIVELPSWRKEESLKKKLMIGRKFDGR